MRDNEDTAASATSTSRRRDGGGERGRSSFGGVGSATIPGQSGGGRGEPSLVEVVEVGGRELRVEFWPGADLSINGFPVSDRPLDAEDLDVEPVRFGDLGRARFPLQIVRRGDELLLRADGGETVAVIEVRS